MSTSWRPSIKTIRDVCTVVSTTSEVYFRGREVYYVYWKQQPYPPLSPGEELLKKVELLSGFTAFSCTLVNGISNWFGPFSFSGTRVPKEGFESCLSQDPLNPQGGSYTDEQMLSHENNSTINPNSSIAVPDSQVLQGIGTRNERLPNQIFRQSIKN